MKAFCIVGTGTCVGKTIVFAGLANYFNDNKLKFEIQKWVSTGDKNNVSEDLLFAFSVLKANQCDNLFRIKMIKNNSNFKYHNPFSFKFPASPHLAARLEQRTIQSVKIRKSIEYFKSRTDYLIIEGVGGLLVPFSKKILLVDLIKQFKLPVVLVSSNILGTINAALSAIQILKMNKIKIFGIVYNNYINENKKIREDNQKIISQFSNIKNLGSIPMLKTKKDLMKTFKPIGANILAQLHKQ